MEKLVNNGQLPPWIHSSVLLARRAKGPISPYRGAKFRTGKALLLCPTKYQTGYKTEYYITRLGKDLVTIEGVLTILGGKITKKKNQQRTQKAMKLSTQNVCRARTPAAGEQTYPRILLFRQTHLSPANKGTHLEWGGGVSQLEFNSFLKKHFQGRADVVQLANRGTFCKKHFSIGENCWWAPSETCSDK